ncbi:hypothetical protein GCM10010329_80550 [Streptomyces spiroverticillatus]|uniref:Uncharacterized protein n=1 Tax=Streptomyces finlayi TaxID=67296 RepID=A0A918X6U6_9ACTN|nr:hypothetical protein [Streptomyces finlayi]GHA45884.1 hypothetical protein GCM10010329_80550 [Streptomyces spiroverticillatus]GHD15935.1 hypothetical protein GCM10010334_76470 [Streptomyces finlayi]
MSTPERTLTVVLDGFLDDEVLTADALDDEAPPVNLRDGVAHFQLVVSPTEERVDELVLPCRAQGGLAQDALTLGTCDLVRVTGSLRLPHHPEDGLFLDVTALEVLESGTDVDHADSTDDLGPAGLSEHGRIERYGAYQVWHAPDTGTSHIWHTSGQAVGIADDPRDLEDLIHAYENPAPHPQEQPPPARRRRLAALLLRLRPRRT